MENSDLSFIPKHHKRILDGKYAGCWVTVPRVFGKYLSTSTLHEVCDEILRITLAGATIIRLDLEYSLQFERVDGEQHVAVG